MHVRFICSRICPGSCGVGDYTRRLAGALAKKGVSVEIVATHDPDVNFSEEVQLSENGQQIPCYRIARRDSVFRREFLKSPCLGREEIWSFQFSSFYAYHPKGVPIGFRNELVRPLRGKRLHIMCHEIGLDPKVATSWERRFLGLYQRIELLNFLKQASCIQTHTPYYLSWLRKHDMAASLLPLFGNIADFPQVRYRFPQLDTISKSSEPWIVGIFGTVHPDWNPLRSLEALLPLLEARGIHMVLTFIGRNGVHCQACIAKLKQALGSRLSIAVLGEQPPERIAAFFRMLQFGFSTNGWGLNSKSGTVAAFLDHGVPVVVTQDTPYASYGEIREGLIRSVRPEFFFEDLRKAKAILTKQTLGLENTADQFLQNIKGSLL